jgi:hypothetical protein
MEPSKRKLDPVYQAKLEAEALKYRDLDYEMGREFQAVQEEAYEGWSALYDDMRTGVADSQPAAPLSDSPPAHPSEARRPGRGVGVPRLHEPVIERATSSRRRPRFSPHFDAARRWSRAHPVWAVLAILYLFITGVAAASALLRTARDVVHRIRSDAPPAGSTFIVHMGIHSGLPCNMNLPTNEFQFINFQIQSLFAFGSLDPTQLTLKLLRCDEPEPPGCRVVCPEIADLQQFWQLDGPTLSVLVDSALLQNPGYYQVGIRSARGDRAFDYAASLSSSLCPTASDHLAFIAPSDGQTLNYGPCYDYIFLLTPIVDATTYRFTFVQNTIAVGREISSNPEYHIDAGDLEHGAIKPGELTVEVEALSEKQEVLQAVTQTVKLVPQPCPPSDTHEQSN